MGQNKPPDEISQRPRPRQPPYPSGRSRIPLRKIRQYYFIDVKTIIFFVIISFSEVSIPATHCINIRGPSPWHSERRRTVAQPAGLVPKHKQRAKPLEVLHLQDPDAHRHALGPGMQEERGNTRGLGTEAQATGAEPAQHTCNPALLLRTRRTSRRQTPTSAQAHFSARNGEEPGRTQHARNPATLLLMNP